MKYLFVGAVEEELAPLKELLGNSENHDYFSCGVGSIEAAANLARYLETSNVENVIFLGSCGASDTDIELLSLVVSSNVHLSERSLVEEDSYLPEIMSKELAASSGLLGLFSGVNVGIFYSATGITCFEGFFEDAFENLELFGIATACSQKDIPWVAVSCVTNHVGPNAHSEWKKNFQAAAEKIAEFIKQNLS